MASGRAAFTLPRRSLAHSHYSERRQAYPAPFADGPALALCSAELARPPRPLPCVRRPLLRLGNGVGSLAAPLAARAARRQPVWLPDPAGDVQVSVFDRSAPRWRSPPAAAALPPAAARPPSCVLPLPSAMPHVSATCPSAGSEMSQQQAGKPGAGGAPGQVPMPFPLVQNIAQLSELRLVVHCCCRCWGAHNWTEPLSLLGLPASTRDYPRLPCLPSPALSSPAACPRTCWPTPRWRWRPSSWWRSACCSSR